MLKGLLNKLPAETQKLLQEYIEKKENNAGVRDNNSYIFTHFVSQTMKKAERLLGNDPVQDALIALNGKIQAEITAQASVITTDESFCDKLKSASIEELSEIKEKIEPLRLINQAKEAIDKMSDDLKQNDTLWTRILVFLSKIGFNTPTATLLIQATESRNILSKVHEEMNVSVKDNQEVNFKSKTIETFLLRKPADTISEKANIQLLQKKLSEKRITTSPSERKKEDEQDSAQCSY